MRSKNAIHLTWLVAIIVVIALFAIAPGRNSPPSATSRGADQAAAGAESNKAPSSDGEPRPGHDHGDDHDHDHGKSIQGTNLANTAAASTSAEHNHVHAAVPVETLERIAREAPQLAASSTTSSDGLKEKPLPGGGFMVDLEGRFQSVAIATVGPDGKIGFTCVSDIDRHGPATTNAAGASVPQTNSSAPPGR